VGCVPAARAREDCDLEGCLMPVGSGSGCKNFEMWGSLLHNAQGRFQGGAVVTCDPMLQVRVLPPGAAGGCPTSSLSQTPTTGGCGSCRGALGVLALRPAGLVLWAARWAAAGRAASGPCQRRGHRAAWRQSRQQREGATGRSRQQGPGSALQPPETAPPGGRPEHWPRGGVFTGGSARC
jgi:hypothetical protein